MAMSAVDQRTTAGGLGVGMASVIAGPALLFPNSTAALPKRGRTALPLSSGG